jgi:hypothetical protein
MDKNKLEFVSLSEDGSLIGEDFTCSGCNNNDGCNGLETALDEFFMEGAPSFVFADFYDSLHVIPNEEQRVNIQRLASQVLQPLHDHFNQPIIIRSGLRTEDKKPVENAETSCHSSGEAVDFSVKGVPILDVLKYVSKNLPYHELMACNVGGTRPYVHVSLRDKDNARRLLSWPTGDRSCVKATL